MGCNGSDEQRLKRHREIAELIQELEQLKKNSQNKSTPETPLNQHIHKPDLNGSSTKKARKEAKRAAKAAEREPIVTSKRIAEISHILHPEDTVDDEREFARSLLLDKSIENNVFYHAGTANSREMRLRFISQERNGFSEPKLTDEELDKILVKLEVPNAEGKSQRAIMKTLREKIAVDFEHNHREEQGMMSRKAGFWRWASRKAYNRLVEHGSIWDHKSGANLAPIGENEAENAAEAEIGPEETANATAVEGAGDHQIGAIDDGQSANTAPTTETAGSGTATSSSTSRGTPQSPDPRAGDSATEESGATIRKPKAATPKATFKMSANGGLGHLNNMAPRMLPDVSSLALSNAGVKPKMVRYVEAKPPTTSPWKAV